MARRNENEPFARARRSGSIGRQSAATQRKTIRLTCSIIQQDGHYLARCLEVAACAPGKTVRQALANLEAALKLYFRQGGAVPASGPAFIEFVEVALPD